MKTLIICESVHHGNTKKIADVMAVVLGADVKKPAEVDVGKLGEYDLIGFGSGIYMGKFHKNMLALVDKMPKLEKNAFIFSTSGRDDIVKDQTGIKEKLAEKGFRIIDGFSCKGLDSVGPLRLIGGINKGRPDAADLEKAKAFAQKLSGSP